MICDRGLWLSQPMMASIIRGVKAIFAKSLVPKTSRLGSYSSVFTKSGCLLKIFFMLDFGLFERFRVFAFLLYNNLIALVLQSLLWKAIFQHWKLRI